MQRSAQDRIQQIPTQLLHTGNIFGTLKGLCQAELRPPPAERCGGIARRRESHTAGWTPANRIFPALATFMSAKGLDGAEMAPQKAAYTLEELARFHVLVCLGQGVAEQIPEVPFHTVLLEWDMETIPVHIDTERATTLLEAALAELQNRIRELMGILRGEEAL